MVARATKPDPTEELRLREIADGASAVFDCFRRLSPRLEPPLRFVPVAEFWAGVARGEPMRLVMSSPPRWGKTTFNEHACAWLMFVRPGTKLLVVSYTASLAEAIAHRIRGLLHRLGVPASTQHRATADDWTARNGSSCVARSVGAATVGIGATIILLDDLVPSMEAATSATQTEHVREWFISTALGRLEPNASVLVCAHRFSTDDLSADLIGANWPWFNCPAIGNDNESTWDRWSTAAMRAREREVGPHVWAAMYQGHPSPKGIGIFLGPPSFYDPAELQAKLAAHACEVFLACDPAATAATHADHSVILTAAFHGNGTAAYPRMMDVIDIWRGQVEIPDLVERLRATQLKWRCPAAIESVAGFRGVGQTLRRINGGLSIFEIKAIGSKYQRALPASAAWSRGHVRFPGNGAPWLDQALAEIASFSGVNDRVDDVPDCLSIAWSCSGLAGVADAKRRRVERIARLLPFG